MNLQTELEMVLTLTSRARLFHILKTQWWESPGIDNTDSPVDAFWERFCLVGTPVVLLRGSVSDERVFSFCPQKDSPEATPWLVQKYLNVPTS